MSITLKTLVIDGEGTEAKMIVADSQDDYALLHRLAMLGYQHWDTPPPAIERLVAMLDKNEPIQRPLQVVVNKKEGEL